MNSHGENLHPPGPAERSVAESALRKTAWRILPILSIGYCLAYMDRINISFASLRMNTDLHFSATTYGLGAGLFFIGYALCEIPSNLLLLRFGPRRWLARIMMTWGLLAVAMMLVRTPTEFYALRLALGIAEAGFFPGVIYYLTLWFPLATRARAVSRFYVALPLSSVVMGSLAGWLLGLDGSFGLKGWQWLFLLEGLPALLFSFVILGLLPDAPDRAKWLTEEEKRWLELQLASDSARAHLGHRAGVLEALVSPKVWLIGIFFFGALTCSYAFNFSAPAILQAATGFSVGRVGMLVAAFGVAGAVAMLLGGASSDRTGERALHCIVPSCVMAAGFLVASYGAPGWLVVVALGVTFMASNALLAPGLAVPTQFLAGRAAAAGIAAMNTITMFSGFIAPYWMGVMKDRTGSYWLGLRSLVVPSLLAAATMVILMRTLKRDQPAVDAQALAGESV